MIRTPRFECCDDPPESPCITDPIFDPKVRASLPPGWLEDADIPMQDEFGNWYDAETGISAEQWAEMKQEKEKAARKKSDPQAKYAEQIEAAKTAAKEAGLPDLRGSAKQKKWAVQIRQRRCEQLPGIFELAKNVDMFGHSPFWIDSRELQAAALLARMRKIIELNREVSAVNAHFDQKYPGQAVFGLDAEDNAQLAKQRQAFAQRDELLSFGQRKADIPTRRRRY